MGKYKTHIVWAIIVVIALVGGYFYGKMSSTTSRSGFAGGYGAFGSSTRRTGGSGAGGGFVAGQVTAMDSSSITLQLANGNSQVVFYSSSTSVSEPTTVPISELATGTDVMIGGTQNSDGSLTAQTIQVRKGNPSGTPQ